MYDMINSGNLLYDELEEWLVEAGFILFLCQVAIYYKYATNGSYMDFNNLIHRSPSSSKIGRARR